MKKKNYHIDEILTFILANNTAEATLIMDEPILDGKSAVALNPAFIEITTFLRRYVMAIF